MDRRPLLAALALLLALVASGTTAEPAQAEGTLPKQDAQGVFEQQVVFPEYPTDEQDAYLCSAVALPDKPLKLVGIESTSDQRIVHHMLLFGAPPSAWVPKAAAVCKKPPPAAACLQVLQAACIVYPLCALVQKNSHTHLTTHAGCDQPAQTDSVWNCKMRSACGAGSEAVLYGWGKNAAPIHLPDGAGFSVGKGTSIRTVVLQVMGWHVPRCRGTLNILYELVLANKLTLPPPLRPVLPNPPTTTTDALPQRPPRQRHLRHQAPLLHPAGALLCRHGRLRLGLQHPPRQALHAGAQLVLLQRVGAAARLRYPRAHPRARQVRREEGPGYLGRQVGGHLLRFRSLHVRYCPPACCCVPHYCCHRCRL